MTKKEHHVIDKILGVTRQTQFSVPKNQYEYEALVVLTDGTQIVLWLDSEEIKRYSQQNSV